MGRRYHCDYCGKSFPDNVNNRKKHLQGVHHIRLRKLHYENFRDAITVLQAESQKKPCRRFQQAGSCDYGTACKFSHISPEELQRLTQQVEADKQKPRVATKTNANLEDWLKEYRRKSGGGEPFGYKGMLTATNVTVHGPPSMQPPTYCDMLECVPSRWGGDCETESATWS
uniref:Zinc finger matrin-type protein 5 n=1 Tax=Ornithodoros turicata TaxID=34597 RepID=A0A2R5LAJ2_9ACAR